MSPRNTPCKHGGRLGAEGER